MNTVVTGGTGLILFCLLMSSVLLAACQQPSSTATGQSYASQQNKGGDQDMGRQRRCCHRAGQTGAK
ncbi:hypothetical protein [Dongia sedimenti]|uniref:Secreted protein n=1 Tax=Dongia sedimenti TaxID=3064282 RepID=A0ABU0YKA7_9PROT|nr:hypothetical protein [Rhodospirillaceae bacterium R-7]